LFTAKQLGNDTPESLVQTAWFYLMLYFGRRGRENQRNMEKEDIVLYPERKLLIKKYRDIVNGALEIRESD